MKTLLAILSLFLLSPFVVKGQDIDESRTKKPKHYTLFSSFQYGNVLQTNETVKGQNSTGQVISNYFTSRLEFGKKTDGSRLWERVHNFPAFGFGLYNLWFMNNVKDFGKPTALYGYYNAPFIRGKNGSFGFKLSLGLSYNWNPFDPDINYLQTAIGSTRNAYVDAEIDYTWYLGKRWDLDLALSLTHFSNGAARVPNAGINLFGPRIGLVYNFNEYTSSPIVYDKGEIPDHKDRNELYFMGALSSRNVKSDSVAPALGADMISKVYPMATIQFIYQREFAWKSKIGGGFDIFYDGSLAADADLQDGCWDENTSYSFGDGLSMAIVGSYEYVISHLSLLIQPGYEFLRKETPGRPGKFFQRVGVKYHFKNDIFIGINVHAIQFSVGRYFEWNAGYRIKWYGK